MKLQCPVCGEELNAGSRSFVCGNRHSFDRSRHGYVNLLQRQKKRLRGDDAAMIRARRDFLESGAYQPLLDAVTAAVAEKSGGVCHLADIGCGEGWYSCSLLQTLLANGNDAMLAGFDISPDALRYAGARAKQMHLQDRTLWAVASVNRIPLADDTADVLINLFAPCLAGEFCRILRPDGLLLRAVPLERHLWELKEALYAEPYENRPLLEAPEGFRLEQKQEIRFRFHVAGAALQNLFAMTPYAHKTAAADAEKLRVLHELDVQAEFGLLRCRRITP